MILLVYKLICLFSHNNHFIKIIKRVRSIDNCYINVIEFLVLRRTGCRTNSGNGRKNSYQIRTNYLRKNFTTFPRWGLGKPRHKINVLKNEEKMINVSHGTSAKNKLPLSRSNCYEWQCCARYRMLALTTGTAVIGEKN